MKRAKRRPASYPWDEPVSHYCPENPDFICGDYTHGKCRERILAEIQQLRDNPDLMFRTWPQ